MINVVRMKRRTFEHVCCLLLLIKVHNAAGVRNAYRYARTRHTCSGRGSLCVQNNVNVRFWLDCGHRQHLQLCRLQHPIHQAQLALHPPRQLKVMGDHDKAGVEPFIEFLHQIKQALCAGAIEVAGGFVGQHAGGFGDQCARDGNALAFAAGKFGGVVRQAFCQTDILRAFRRRWGRPVASSCRVSAAAWRRFPAR